MLENLSPKMLWSYFEQITKIPRPSKHEEKITEFLKSFAIENSLKYKQDDAGNVVIYAPATPGYENHEPVILQSHVDMVCEKNSDVEFDFFNDPLNIYIEDGWIKAKGTTLGADCGIGMTIALALITDKSVEHPALEALFTVDEETGLTGAKELDFSMLSSRRLINLDSEDEGELYIGCAGGCDTVGYFDLSYSDKPKDSVTVEISINGLLGGHSGDDINKLRANSVVLLCRILFMGFNNFNLNLVNINAGGLRNAIPREAYAKITLPKDGFPYFERFMDSMISDIKNEYHATEKEISISYDLVENCSETKVIDREIFLAAITSVFTMPSGVMAMSQDIDGFVETSTNVASVKISDRKIIVTTSQRSSIESKRDYTAAIVTEIMEGCGAEVERGDGYPGWTPNPSSPMIDLFRKSHQKLFNKEIVVKAVHAGLECGLFSEKSEGLDMVSIGPTIRGVHSPAEKLEIASVENFWVLIKDVLSEM